MTATSSTDFFDSCRNLSWVLGGNSRDKKSHFWSFATDWSKFRQAVYPTFCPHTTAGIEFSLLFARKKGHSILSCLADGEILSSLAVSCFSRLLHGQGQLGCYDVADCSLPATVDFKPSANHFLPFEESILRESTKIVKAVPDSASRLQDSSVI